MEILNWNWITFIIRLLGWNSASEIIMMMKVMRNNQQRTMKMKKKTFNKICLFSFELIVLQNHFRKPLIDCQYNGMQLIAFEWFGRFLTWSRFNQLELEQKWKSSHVKSFQVDNFQISLNQFKMNGIEWNFFIHVPCPIDLRRLQVKNIHSKSSRIIWQIFCKSFSQRNFSLNEIFSNQNCLQIFRSNYILSA